MAGEVGGLVSREFLRRTYPSYEPLINRTLGLGVRSHPPHGDFWFSKHKRANIQSHSIQLGLL